MKVAKGARILTNTWEAGNIAPFAGAIDSNHWGRPHYAFDFFELAIEVILKTLPLVV